MKSKLALEKETNVDNIIVIWHFVFLSIHNSQLSLQEKLKIGPNSSFRPKKWLFDWG